MFLKQDERSAGEFCELIIMVALSCLSVGKKKKDLQKYSTLSVVLRIFLIRHK
jgi:hypothetical protein